MIYPNVSLLHLSPTSAQMVSPDPRVVDTARVTTGAEGRGGAMGGATGRVMGGNTTESINLI